MKFPAKILLFGEHAVIKGSKALAIPYNKFFCELTFDKNKKHLLKDSTAILTKIYEYILNCELAFDYEAFKEDLSKGAVYQYEYTYWLWFRKLRCFN